MRKAFFITTSMIFSVGLFISCSKDGGSGGGGGGTTVDCNTVTNKAFAADVNPIIQSSCNQPGCHAAGSSNGPGALTNYNQVSANKTAIRSAIASGRMPQGSSLTAGQKNSILCWIDGGAPNN